MTHSPGIFIQCETAWMCFISVHSTPAHRQTHFILFLSFPYHYLLLFLQFSVFLSNTLSVFAFFCHHSSHHLFLSSLLHISTGCLFESPCDHVFALYLWWHMCSKFTESVMWLLHNWVILQAEHCVSISTQLKITGQGQNVLCYIFTSWSRTVLV